MRVTQYRIEGLGHLSTLIADDEAGVAAVIDPRRDVDIYLDAARQAGLRISHVLETHLHNDYVSGGHELATLTGASHVIGAGAELRHAYQPARDGDTFDLGSIRFTTLDTPGHTPEHVSYAVADLTRADEPFLLLTGGSLLVGAVGRTDLLGAEHAGEYAAAMYRSLHDVLLRHEDSVMVYPTHGAGSLCSTGIASTSWSTIGYERRHDPLLGPLEVEAFARALLAGQPTIPRYFARMRPMNQAGPRLLGATMPAIEPLAGDELDAALGGGALVVDTRTAEAHAHQRIPGSLSIPAGPSFGTWLGWVVDADRPIVLLVNDEADLDDLARQAARIGVETIVGHVGGGLRAWRGSGRPIQTGTAFDVDRLASQLAAGGAGRARRHRRPAGVRVRGRSRAGFSAYRRGRAAGHARQASARPPDRHDLCQRLPLERCGLDAPRGRVRARRGGRWRAAGLGGAWLRDRLRTGRRGRSLGARGIGETHAH